MLQQNVLWIGGEQRNFDARTIDFSIAYPVPAGEDSPASCVCVGTIAQDQAVLFFFAIDRPIEKIGVARPRSGSPGAWLMDEDEGMLLQTFGVAKCGGRHAVPRVHSHQSSEIRLSSCFRDEQ